MKQNANIGARETIESIRFERCVSKCFHLTDNKCIGELKNTNGGIILVFFFLHQKLRKRARYIRAGGEKRVD